MFQCDRKSDKISKRYMNQAYCLIKVGNAFIIQGCFSLTIISGFFDGITVTADNLVAWSFVWIKVCLLYNFKSILTCSRNLIFNALGGGFLKILQMFQLFVTSIILLFKSAYCPSVYHQLCLTI